MITKPPTVSVILSFFNQEVYVAAAIESVLRQSLAPFELLVLDDGSTDGTAGIIRAWAEKDKRIRAYYGPNRGKCGAVNFLLAQARGSYCAFMDGDDTMEPTRLAAQVAALEANPQLAGVSCHCHYIDAKGRRMGRQRYPHLSSIAANEAARQNGSVVLFAFTGLTMRRGIVESAGGLNHRFWPCEDLELANRLLDAGHNVVILDKCLMNYRIHKASVTGSWWWEMRKKSVWTAAIITGRRQGVMVLNYQKFIEEKERGPWVEKLRFVAAGLSILHQRQALFSFYRKRMPNALYHASIMVLMRPSFGWAIIRNRVL